MKEHQLDLEICGMFARGQPWGPRTGSSTVKRLHRACIKYLGCGLDTREDPGLFLCAVNDFNFFLGKPESRWPPYWNMACMRTSAVSHYKFLGYHPPEVASLSGHKCSDDRMTNTYTGKV